MTAAPLRRGTASAVAFQPDGVVAAARRELEAVTRAYREESARLSRDGPTSREWMRLVIKRDDALRHLHDLAPGDPLLNREREADLATHTAAWLRLGRQRIASLAGQLFRADLPASQVLGLCLDHNRGHYTLTDEAAERVVRWVAERELQRVRGRG